MVKLLILIFFTCLPAFAGITENGLSALEQKSPSEQVNIITTQKPKLSPEAVKAFALLIYDKDNPQLFNQILNDLLESKPDTLIANERIKDVIKSLSKKDAETLSSLLEDLTRTYSSSFTADIETLKQLYSNLEPATQEKFLLALMGEINTDDLQQYVTDTIGSTYYAELLDTYSESICEAVSSIVKPSYFATTPLIDALNTLNLPNFYSPTAKNSLLNREHFHDFNTFEQANFFVMPYGHYTEYDQGKDTPKFDLYTIGISVGGEYTFLEKITLGLGGAYSFSELHLQPNDELAKFNTLYIGPYLGYLFPRGALSFTLLGAMNFIYTKRKLSLFPERGIEPKYATSNYNSWDIVSRLEGVFFQPLGEEFYLNPSARIDYIHVFQGKNIESLDKKSSLQVESLHESFLQIRLGLELKREVYKPKVGFIVPSLIWAWNHFAPLSKNSYHYTIDGCEAAFTAESTLESWDTFSYGAGLALVFKKGVYLSFDYELSLGASQTQHKGTIRASLSW